MDEDWPYHLTEQQRRGMLNELRRELPDGHVLAGVAFEPMDVLAIGGDNIMLALDEGRVAIVHLTWLGRKDPRPDHPWTVVYDSLEAARAAWDAWLG